MSHLLSRWPQKTRLSDEKDKLKESQLQSSRKFEVKGKRVFTKALRSAQSGAHPVRFPISPPCGGTSQTKSKISAITKKITAIAKLTFKENFSRRIAWTTSVATLVLSSPSKTVPLSGKIVGSHQPRSWQHHRQ